MSGVGCGVSGVGCGERGNGEGVKVLVLGILPHKKHPRSLPQPPSIAKELLQFLTELPDWRWLGDRMP